MIDDKNLITLKEKLKSLESEIPDLLEKVKMARLDGDLSENADWIAISEKYETTKRKIGILRERIRKKMKNKNFESRRDFIIYKKVGEDKEVCVELVEDWDADPLNGKISKSCPLGVALNGKMAGETTEVITSKGSYKVIIIRK